MILSRISLTGLFLSLIHAFRLQQRVCITDLLSDRGTGQHQNMLSGTHVGYWPFYKIPKELCNLA